MACQRVAGIDRSAANRQIGLSARMGLAAMVGAGVVLSQSPRLMGLGGERRRPESAGEVCGLFIV